MLSAVLAYNLKSKITVTRRKNSSDEIGEKAPNLPDPPKRYKPSPRVKGMRELVAMSNYIVLYRETPSLVEVVNVFHARRQWP